MTGAVLLTQRFAVAQAINRRDDARLDAATCTDATAGYSSNSPFCRLLLCDMTARTCKAASDCASAVSGAAECAFSGALYKLGSANFMGSSGASCCRALRQVSFAIADLDMNLTSRRSPLVNTDCAVKDSTESNNCVVKHHEVNMCPCTHRTGHKSQVKAGRIAQHTLHSQRQYMPDHCWSNTGQPCWQHNGGNRLHVCSCVQQEHMPVRTRL
jgi:hypothetical protein